MILEHYFELSILISATICCTKVNINFIHILILYFELTLSLLTQKTLRDVCDFAARNAKVKKRNTTNSFMMYSQFKLLLRCEY